MFFADFFREKIYKFPKNLEKFYYFLSLLIILITCVPPFRSIQSISYWIKGYYYVNYFDLGFIKRGLVGTIIKITNLPLYLSPSTLVLSFHIFFVILLGVIFWILAKRSFSNYKFKDKVFYYSMFLLSPVLFLRIGYDIGRMDLFLLIITLFAIISIQNKYSTFLGNSLFISICISTQLLIHDASLLFYTPLIVCFYFYEYSNLISQKFKTVIIIFSIPILIGALLLNFGKYELGPIQLEQYLQNISTELSGSMQMELTNTFKQNATAGLGLLTFKGFLGGNYLITIYYAFLLFILFRFVKLANYLKLSVFSPLLVSFIAMDHTRYLAISAVCCNLIFLIAAKESQLFSPEKFRLGFYIFFVFIFFLGPWGIGSYDALPLLKHYL